MKTTQPNAIRQWPEEHLNSTNTSLGKFTKDQLRWSRCRGASDFFQLLWSALSVYCKRGCLVGTRYLAEPNYHITERIFWIITLMLSFFSGYYVIKMYLNSYERNVFQLIIEDRPLTNDVDFPTVGLCEYGKAFGKDFTRLLKGIHEKYPKLMNISTFRYFIHSFAFQDAYEKDSFRNFYKTVHETPELDEAYYNTLDYVKMIEEAHSSCSQFFHKCFWNETSFECCDFFRPVNTLVGKCFLLNSLQTEKLNFSKVMLVFFFSKFLFDFFSNTFLDMRVSGYMERSYIKVIFTRPAQIFLLNGEDIPERLTPFPKFTMQFASQAGYMEFNLVPMVNDPEIYALRTEVRKCFSNATPQADMPPNMSLTYPYLSYSSCLTECVRHAQLLQCGCIHWKLNKGTKAAEASYCDLEGYVCLERYGLIHLKSMRNLPLRACDMCLPSCNEAGILYLNYDYVNEFSLLGNNYSITLAMLSFPPRQMRRQLVRGDLDVVVSLGGILSLFMGCNLLNLIEFLFIVARVMLRGDRQH